MKTLIALIASVSLPFAAQAQAQRAVASADTVSSSSSCSISSGDGVSSLDWSWGMSNPSIVGQVLRVSTTPSSGGGAPVVVAMAINTKGMGANDRQISSASGGPDVTAHAINSKGTGCSVRLIKADAGKAPRDFACRINPGSSVTIFNPPPPPIADKASFQDFHFVSSSSADRVSAGPGGGPRVLTARCSGADGAPSSVSLLLLPAVQK